MTARQFPAVLRFVDPHAGPLIFSAAKATQAKPAEREREKRIRDLEAELAALTRRVLIAEAKVKATKAGGMRMSALAPARRESALLLDARRRGWVK